jgi:hypothetical protein
VDEEVAAAAERKKKEEEEEERDSSCCCCYTTLKITGACKYTKRHTREHENKNKKEWME